MGKGGWGKQNGFGDGNTGRSGWQDSWGSGYAHLNNNSHGSWGKGKYQRESKGGWHGNGGQWQHRPQEICLSQALEQMQQLQHLQSLTAAGLVAGQPNVPAMQPNQPGVPGAGGDAAGAVAESVVGMLRSAIGNAGTAMGAAVASHVWGRVAEMGSRTFGTAEKAAGLGRTLVDKVLSTPTKTRPGDEAECADSQDGGDSGVDALRKRITQLERETREKENRSELRMLQEKVEELEKENARLEEVMARKRGAAPSGTDADVLRVKLARLEEQNKGLRRLSGESAGVDKPPDMIDMVRAALEAKAGGDDEEEENEDTSPPITPEFDKEFRAFLGRRGNVRKQISVRDYKILMVGKWSLEAWKEAATKAGVVPRLRTTRESCFEHGMKKFEERIKAA